MFVRMPPLTSNRAKGRVRQVGLCGPCWVWFRPICALNLSTQYLNFSTSKMSDWPKFDRRILRKTCLPLDSHFHHFPIRLVIGNGCSYGGPAPWKRCSTQWRECSSLSSLRGLTLYFQKPCLTSNFFVYSTVKLCKINEYYKDIWYTHNVTVYIIDNMSRYDVIMIWNNVILIVSCSIISMIPWYTTV